MYRLALPCCLALVGLLLPAAAADPPLGLKDAQALQEALQKAIEDAEPAIACILVARHEAFLKVRESSADNPGKLGDFDPDRERKKFGLKEADLDKLKLLDPGNPANVPESYGSGVVVDESGLILTNYHVVRDATKLFVRLPGGKSSYADIHAADPRSDLAVLRLLKPPSGLKALKLGDGGKVRKGQLVLSIANPFAAGFRDGNPSASWGIVSNLRRRAPLAPADSSQTTLNEMDRKKTLHHYGTLIQTDNRINLGCSGGALVDLKGELIGLTTALAALGGTETPGGFAVPMDTPLKRIVEVLKRGEEVEYGFLGVSPSTARTAKGVMIDNITPWSPAYRAGLRANDIILSVDGTPVNDTDDLFLAIGTVLANSEAKIEVKSLSGQIRTVTATMAKFYVPGPIIASKKPAAVRGLRVDYVSVLLLSTKGGGMAYPALPPGVMVREVQANTAAASANLKVNDVITHVNGKAVTTPAEFYREAQKASGPLELTLDPSRTVKIN